MKFLEYFLCYYCNNLKHHIMKKFYEIRKDCLNKKYFQIDDIDNGNVKIQETNYTLNTAYPFEIDEREEYNQIIVVDGKQYYRRGAYLIPMEYVHKISREEYVRRTLELECQFDSEVKDDVRDDKLKDMTISEFVDELKQAFINKVYSISIDSFGETPYSDFVKYACDSLIDADPHLIYIDEITGKEIQMWIVLSKPGYFIGKYGEVINFWTERLNNILKIYNPEYTLSIRIKEMQVLNYKDCEIIL